ncbi:GbsR/MarR family transcriptional regulator [Stackebrandtia nassauensis]|uniref:Uncharacterized protein n=1 Tax=Stackebrandtia nassauensis (strain DSM 44728 / CIP 108903 / NRRL B-16338 / NBRC 102104 / LLR-40K-21) TaxID=446470 RepID=D3Q7E6_STANL|nr:helix-turn-helix domain-containing protein [Stackebrandtia nassauensis]ADD42417.1 conserved hypothetical protein [Stackebrandtia nassauensis DSM 44728]
MASGHLTHEERRRIAHGLAEGLGYAEIARHLDRPTSTVSREVARNGGARDYRPNRAHQAARQRARRRGPRPAPTAPADAAGRDSRAVLDFEERFAEMMIHTGLQPMPSRVLARLFTSDTGSLTAAELVTRLRVSPASVSKAVGYLEQLHMITRERDNRRERYLINDDVWYESWKSSMRSIGIWADTARQGAEILGATTPAGARLTLASQFYDFLRHDMEEAAELWRRITTAR